MKINDENYHPTTSAQREVWLLQQQHSDLTFNISEYATIRGPLNRELLKKAVEQSVMEEPALHATFHLIDGQLMQYQGALIKPELNIININSDDSNNSVETWIDNDIKTPVDIAKGPLFSFNLLILAENSIIFHHRYHHILMDGRSICLMAKKISERYNTLSLNTAQLLPAASLVPDRLARQENHYLESSRFTLDEAYWQQQYPGSLPDRLTRLSDNHLLRDIHKVQRPLGKPLAGRLDDLARQSRLTRSHLLIAATAAWLYQTSGCRTLTFAIPVTGCSKAEQDCIGMTANILPLRLTLAPDHSFHQLLATVKRQLSMLMRHQRYRGENLLRQHGQSCGFGPAINLLFFSHGAPFHGTETRWIKASGSQVNGFSVMFDDEGFGEDPAVSFFSSATRHSRPQLEACQQQFHLLLDHLSRQPDSLLEQLPGEHSSPPGLFSLLRQPPAAGVIRWQQQDAEQIASLAQVLAVCPHTQPPATTLKLLLCGELYTLAGVTRSQHTSDCAAGTLLSIGGRGWSIATRTQDITLHHFHHLSGEPCDPVALANHLQLAVGSQLDDINDVCAQGLENQFIAMQRDETFWQHRLRDTDPLRLPFAAGPDEQSLRASAWQPCEHPSVLIAAFAAWLGNLTGADTLDIGWYMPQPASSPGASWVPFRLQHAPSATLRHIAGELDSAIAHLRKHTTFARDLFQRDPLLRQALKTYDVGLVTGEEPVETLCEAATAPRLILQFSPHDRAVRWVYEASLNEVASQLTALLTLPPTTQARQVPLVNAATRHHLLSDLNHTLLAVDPSLTLSAAFSRQAELTPTAIALSDDNGELTFQALEAASYHLAQQLIAFGIRADRPVGLCMARSIQQIVALLAIVRSGGCYLPLDPSWPTPRLKSVLAQAQPTLLFADNIGRDALGELPDSSIWDPIQQLQQPLPPPVPLPHNCRSLVYILFTSGSTGQPKGVMVEHAQLMNLYAGLKQQVFCHYPAAARVCLNASLAFDASLQSILAMVAGHQLVIVPEAVRRDGSLILEFLQQKNIAVFDCTPTQLEMLCLAGLEQYAKPLVMLIGGEALPASRWQWLAAQSHLTAFNLYGPTECTVDATVALITPTDPLPTLGHPLANTRLYLLNAQHQPVPVGAAGQLWIGGQGVARGYLGQPDLTLQRFITDPFVNDKSRLYDSGDLARYRADGSLEYLGRSDDQVKINGYRLEPGEIEHQLRQHPSIHNAIVVVLPGPAGENQLVCYYLTGDDAAPQDSLAHQLRDALTATLPQWMIPVAWVHLDRMPVTASGKVDRRALPPPGKEAWLHEHYQPPQNDAERLLQQLWTAILQQLQPGRDDHFFALGGDSLLAMKLLAQLHQSGWQNLRLSDLFAHPTLAGQAALMQPQHRTTSAGSILPVTPRQRFPLSSSQCQLWFIDQMNNLEENYLVPLLLDLRGTLNVGKLRQAMNALLARHDVLRATFHHQQGDPWCQILPCPEGMTLTEWDLRARDCPAGASDALVHQEMSTPFDLSQNLPIRATLIRLDDTHYRLLVVLHHIVTDGASMAILLEELSQLYNGTGSLAPLEIHYPDYAAWQQQQRGSPTWLAARRYWQQQLAQLPERLSLPTDRVRPARQSFDGGSMPVEIDSALTRRLRQFSQQQGCTLFMLLLSAWSVVLSRLSGQNDLAIGIPVNNRPLPQCEPVVGFFVNTLPLRVDLSAHPCATALVAQVKQTLLAMQEHQSLPFEELVAIAQPERSLDKSPLFQVIFSWEGKSSLPQMAGIQLEKPPLTASRVKFDLELTLTEQSQGITGSLNFASALFNPATICRHRDYLLRVLQQMLSSEQPVTRLPMLSAEERDRQLRKWNQTDERWPHSHTACQLIEQQASDNPQHVALRQGDVSLSYDALNQQANLLAMKLVDQGVSREQRVLICCDRSPQMVVAMLATLKAGAAWLMVPPDIPQARLAFILSDASPAAILCSPAALHRFSDWPEPLLLNDAPPPAQRFANLNLPGTPQDLAYVIYTSGSTGQPKGVMAEQRNLVQLASRWAARWQVAPGSTLLQFCSTTFDATVAEIFTAICSGATLVLRDDRWLTDTRTFWQLCERYAISHAILPWQFWRMLCEESEGPLPSSLRALWVGGEAADPAMLTRWLEKYPHTPQLVNCYGPTETSVIATAHTPVAGEAHIASIGKPIANVRAYILDEAGQLLPQGATGELVIGGCGVTRGYLNLPGVGAERFVSDPFSDQPDARMYRTGDLASWLDDGRLMYHGRDDHQVKIRGFRIEPGEIETRLNQHPQIRESLVLAEEDHHGSNQLLAWFVPAAGLACPTEAQLRDWLQQSLPDYMIPAALMALQTMPVTANGKRDRSALPRPTVTEAVRGQPPQTPTEQQLAAIWQSLLQQPELSRDAHFFRHGGHSLLAVRAIGQIAQRLGVSVPLAVLFDHPHLHQLAGWIDRHASSAQPPPTMAQADRQRPLPLSFAQQRLWFIHQLEQDAGNYNALMILRLTGEVSEPALQLALNSLYARHEALRSRFISPDDSPQVVLAAASEGIPLQVLNYRHASDPSPLLQRFYREEECHLFDLAADRLIRASLIQLADRRSVLVLTLHHIITDAWSMAILARELGQVYSAQVCQQPVSLPSLALQYPDYAAWQQQWRDGAQWQEQGRFWQQQLAGSPPLLTLPLDRPRPAQPSAQGGSLPLLLDATLSEQLRQLSERHHGSLFITLVSAWSVVLSRLAGQQEVVIGSPAANRSPAACEEMMGFFVNMLPLHIQSTPGITVAELLAQVRQRALAAQDNQALPFEQMVELHQPERTMASTPLFQVMFALESRDDLTPALYGLDVALEEVAATRVKYDLELSLGDRLGQISGTLQYREALFDPTTIERHIGYLLRVLRAMVASDSMPVDRIELLSDNEVEHLLARSGPECDWPQIFAHQLFEQQVASQPQALALIAGEQQWTYASLNQWANLLAHRMIDHGVGTQDIVAVCAGRSPETIVAILAILKVGAAWFCLPPDSSEQRRRFILQDARPRLILAQPDSAALFRDEAIDCWTLAPHDAALTRDDNPLSGPVDRQRLAYLIYTSGSTGHPKGVLVEQSNLVHHLVTWSRRRGIGRGSRMLQFCSLTFDVSVSEILSALTSGAALVLRDDEWLNGTDTFWQQCERYAISHMDLPYQFWSQLCQESHRPLPASLNTLVFGGEAAAPERLTQWLQRYPQQPILVNGYGPTETTVTATEQVARPGISHPDAIGYPLDNTRCYILDARGQLLPDGCIGELYIAGPCVARGYLNLPEMTADRFLPDPFHPLPGARMYRSGDLARWLPDGRLMFHGRNDHQVKIRGFRVELGEIENVLNRHPRVGQALVLAQPYQGHQRLVAWIVPADASLTLPALRDYLVASLPDYMVPTGLVQIAALPLTANGKIDHKALPAPAEEADTADFLPPLPGLEQQLAAIWQTLLDRRIGRDDNFFTLGGHSLLVVSCVTRINRLGDVQARVSDIFNAPTIRLLAQRLCGPRQEAAGLLDLRSEAILPAAITALPAEVPMGESILLTGASGFVGRFLLRQLLNDGEQRIYCLVRGSSAQESRQRLIQVMQEAELWNEDDASRVVVMCADLRQPQLGLNDTDWQRLCTDTGIIWHAAVSMNHLESWEMAHPANIGGLITLLRMTTQGARKIFNFLSTVNVFSTLGQRGTRQVSEHSSIDDEQHLSSQGYIASKWVGEALVNQAIQRGVACHIMRLGLITPDAQRARYDRQQAVDRLLRSSLQMGMAFTDVLGDIPLLPVDFTAAALVQLGHRWPQGQSVWHLAAMKGLSRAEFIARLNAQLAQPMQIVTHKAWLQEARRRAERGETLPITPLIQDLLLAGEEQLAHYYQSLEESHIEVDAHHTFARLAAAGLTPAAPDDAWFARLAERLQR